MYRTNMAVLWNGQDQVDRRLRPLSQYELDLYSTCDCSTHDSRGVRSDGTDSLVYPDV